MQPKIRRSTMPPLTYQDPRKQRYLTALRKKQAILNMIGTGMSSFLGKPQEPQRKPLPSLKNYRRLKIKLGI